MSDKKSDTLDALAEYFMNLDESDQSRIATAMAKAKYCKLLSEIPDSKDSMRARRMSYKLAEKQAYEFIDEYLENRKERVALEDIMAHNVREM